MANFLKNCDQMLCKQWVIKRLEDSDEQSSFDEEEEEEQKSEAVDHQISEIVSYKFNPLESSSWKHKKWR